MLIELVEVTALPDRGWRARVRTAFGDVELGWCGDRDAAPGEYHVEWTIDADVYWGRNMRPAAGGGPGVRGGGNAVIVRGRLSLTVDGAALLDLGGHRIPLDLAAPLPGEAVGTWVELRVERDEVALYPYFP